MIPIYEVRKIRWVKETKQNTCEHAKQVLSLAHKELNGLDRERLLAFYLNGQNKVVGIETIGIGFDSGVATRIPCIFRGAVISGATSIILVHNHPGGTTEPSEQDEKLRQTVFDAGTILDCPLVDFIIVTNDIKKYWSWYERSNGN